MKAMTSIMIAAMVALPSLAADDDRVEAQKKLQRAEAVLRASLDAPDKGIPQDALEKAECVGVFPDVAKGAFIVGGTGGTGVFTCRDKSGKMGAPAFYTIGGASVGWQFGGQQTDLVLLVMNEGGMKNLLQDKFTIGAEATATAGPVGRTGKAATDAQLQAQILSWSRSQGAFLGAALEGTVVKPDQSRNEAVYGKGTTTKSILLEHRVAPTGDAKAFLKTVNQGAERKG